MVAQNTQSPAPKFPLGHVVATPGAIEALVRTGTDASVLLARHVGGDFGDICDEDRKLNDEAMVSGERILSAYTLSGDIRLWIVTEADRSVTTLLLPEDY